jgi:hypothetical protein
VKAAGTSLEILLSFFFFSNNNTQNTFSSKSKNQSKRPAKHLGFFFL